MAYNHGIVTSERETSVISTVTAESALPVVFGTAPINMGNMENVNKPVLCYSYKEAVEELGYIEDLSGGFTLPEVINACFSLYGISPVIFVNVLDPSEHKESKSETSSFSYDTIIVESVGVIKSSVVISASEVTFKEGRDYELSFTKTGYLRINRVETGTIPLNGEVSVEYNALKPSLVTASDIIGGIDANTNSRKGIELTEEIYPRFGLVPSLLAAPGFSQNNAVALALAAKGENINGLFKAAALADIQDGSIKKYSEVSEWKNSHSLTRSNLALFWPKVTLSGKEYFMSTHAIGVIAATDSNHEEIPYKSPSNEPLNIDGLINGGKEVVMTPDEAAYLNSQGIITGLNFSGGFKLWGNRTAAYPSVTDVKDCMLPVRRMFAWFNNIIILTYWQKVDYPIRKRTIDNITDNITFWLNGLTSRGIILGGRIVFDEAENPVTDLMDGIIRFHLYVTPPSPAREISFTLEYEPEYLQTLFK